jgi:hypothetical protein
MAPMSHEEAEIVIIIIIICCYLLSFTNPKTRGRISIIICIIHFAPS